MTDYHVIVLVCVLGVVGEAVRLQRSGQTMIGPDWRGRYGWRPPVSESVTPRVLPLFPMPPTFRLRDEPAVDERLDVVRARREIQAILVASRRVLPFSRLLFVYLVVLVPVALLTGLVAYRWYVLGFGLLAIQGPLLVEYFVTHRRLRPAARGQRIQDLLLMLMFPPAGVAAAEAFATEALAQTHPVAAAAVLCPDPVAREVAGHYLRLWRNPLTESERESAAACQPALADFLAEQGWDERVLGGPPVRHEEQSESYCPRCHAQFLVVDGTCPDCPGIARRPFEQGGG